MLCLDASLVSKCLISCFSALVLILTRLNVFFFFYSNLNLLAHISYITLKILHLAKHGILFCYKLLSALYMLLSWFIQPESSIAMTTLRWWVECNAESDGHGLRVATSRKLPQKVLMCWKSCIPHTRGSWGEILLITYYPIHVPEVG